MPEISNSFLLKSDIYSFGAGQEKEIGALDSGRPTCEDVCCVTNLMEQNA
jgi:hypothetical protein